jgi:hypothetical protein
MSWYWWLLGWALVSCTFLAFGRGASIMNEQYDEDMNRFMEHKEAGAKKDELSKSD